MKTKLLLFDFDGTLFNTADGIHKAVNIVAEERGAKAFSKELVQNLIGYGLLALLEKLDEESKHQLGQLEDFRHRFREVYDELAVEHSSLFPGAIEFLQSWKGDLAIVSNKGETILNKMVKESELSQFHWKSIIGGDSLKEKKPHPLPIKAAMSQANAGIAETLLVGDGVPDARASMAANIPFVGVKFGYGPESELIQNGCRFFIESYSELPMVIQTVDASRKSG